MQNSKNALVILWTGNPISEYLVQKIVEPFIVNNVTTPELLTFVYKDQDGLANCLVKEANGISTIKFDIVDDKLSEALEKSIIYIGKRFEASLINAKGNLVFFAIDLQSALTKARTNASFNSIGISDDDKALINAVELLATTKAIIPASLAKKYHMNKSVFDVIKQIHNQFA